MSKRWPRLPSPWDHYSDQPEIIRDRAFKKRLRLSAIGAHLRSFFIFVLSLPLIVWKYFRLPAAAEPGKNSCSEFFGLCVNVDKLPDQSFHWVSDLGVRNVLVRVPLADVGELDQYVTFMRSLAPARIHINVLQDWESIANEQLVRERLRLVFDTLSPLCRSFQIGNAVNRLKWGFASMEDYLRFYAIAERVRDEDFPELELSGSSVIDFEPVSTVRSLIHGFSRPFDKVAALLYVDRRGAPENVQYGYFDLRRKIRFVRAAMNASGHANQDLIISETNWPLIDTEPYAPAVGECCVSEDAAADYLVRYYLESMSTGMVECVYWHQLVAPGYGLLDHRCDPPRHHQAYASYKTMVGLLSPLYFKDCAVISNDLYMVQFTDDDNELKITVVWSLSTCPFPEMKADRYLDRDGGVLSGEPKLATGSPVYCCH